ncbi:MAG: endonuclease/exonuclease/phosphatase family protein [Bacteroidota bacterium]|nr:endonuclease/exonuclease/phosphatase family protein [Bacteroidota bacterium]
MKNIIYKILKYLNIIFIAALLLSYLSVYISPAKIWILAFFGLAYPFLLIINLLFLIFWIAKQRLFLIFPLIAILSGWNYLNTYIQIPINLKNQKEELVERSFNLLSFNVRSFDLYQWSEKETTKDEIFQFINNGNFSIICFQDFFTRNKGDLSETDIHKKLNQQYQSHIGYAVENTNQNLGVATYSKHPIVNQGIIKFSKSFNVSIFTDIVIEADTLRIFNIHLQSIRFNEDNYKFITNSKTLKDEEKLKEIKDISTRLRDAFIKRANQAETLSAYIQKSPYPVILCGDFNDVPVSYTYQTLKSNLKDSFVSAGQGIGNTYIGKFPSFRIDYIFYSKELECKSFNIHNVRLSDHFPLTGEFYLKH